MQCRGTLIHLTSDLIKGRTYTDIHTRKMLCEDKDWALPMFLQVKDVRRDCQPPPEAIRQGQDLSGSSSQELDQPVPPFWLLASRLWGNAFLCFSNLPSLWHSYSFLETWFHAGPVWGATTAFNAPGGQGGFVYIVWCLISPSAQVCSSLILRGVDAKEPLINLLCINIYLCLLLCFKHSQYLVS